MSYSEAIVASKLASVNETPDSIVSISQWVMFHRRHAVTTVQTWLRALHEASTHRKLCLIYLANEVAQQSRARKKDEFLTAFSPVIAGALVNTYTSANTETRNKLRRVVQVWRQRQIFSNEVVDEIDSRIDELDKGKPSSSTRSLGVIGSRGIGGVGGGAGVPREFSKLVAAHTSLTEKLSNSSIRVSSAASLFSNLPADERSDSKQTELASEAVQSAIITIKETIEARQNLINQAQAIVDIHSASLKSEVSQLEEFEGWRDNLSKFERTTTPDGKSPTVRTHEGMDEDSELEKEHQHGEDDEQHQYSSNGADTYMSNNPGYTPLDSSITGGQPDLNKDNNENNNEAKMDPEISRILANLTQPPQLGSDESQQQPQQHAPEDEQSPDTDSDIDSEPDVDVL